MPKQIHFYATKKDILPILDAFEEKVEVKYIPSGGSKSDKPVTFLRGAKLPNLGRSTDESSSGSAPTGSAPKKSTSRPNRYLS